MHPNSDVLKNAVLTYTVEDGVITNISSIELLGNGNATDELVLDGQDATFTGTIKVNGDYITLKNITIQNNLEIGKEVATSFSTSEISVLGKTTISDEAASGKLARAAATKQPKLTFANSTFRSVEVDKKDEVGIELKGNSSIRELNLSSDIHITANNGTSLPNVAVNQGVKRITLDGSVDSLSVNTPNALTIDGTANIDRIIVKSKNTKIKFRHGHERREV